MPTNKTKYIMKKFIPSILIMLLINCTIVAQPVLEEEIADLRERILKSDKKIIHNRKSKKVATWNKRADLFIEAAQITTEHLKFGMENVFSNNINSSNMKTVIALKGEPDSKKKIEGSELEKWTYEYIELIVCGNYLSDCLIIKSIVDKPLINAYNSILQAIELDKKNKYVNKIKTKQKIKLLKHLLVQKSFALYKQEKYVDSFDYLEKTIVLDKYPKLDSLTGIKTIDIYYYAAHFALQAVINNKNENYFEKIDEYYTYCIDNRHEKSGICCANLARSKFLQDKDTEGLEILLDAEKKYHENFEIILSLLNYYHENTKNYETMQAYADKAIELKPDNVLLYFVKADICSKIFYISENENDFKDAVEIYNIGFEKSKKEKNTIDAHFSLGQLYYFNALLIYDKAQDLPITNQDDEYEQIIKQYEDNLKLALSEMEKVYELKPKDVSAMNYLLLIYKKLKLYNQMDIMQLQITIYELENKK